MTERYDIKTPRERRDGKTYWLKIGAMFPGDGDQYTIMLDALPIPNSEGKVVLKAYPPREETKSQDRGEDDGMPF